MLNAISYSSLLAIFEKGWFICGQQCRQGDIYNFELRYQFFFQNLASRDSTSSQRWQQFCELLNSSTGTNFIETIQ